MRVFTATVTTKATAAKTTAALAGLAALAATVLPASPAAAVPAAESAEPGNIVMFGDSIVANPPELSNFGGIRLLSAGNDTCNRGEHRLATELTATTGRVIDDHSCPGATATDSDFRKHFGEQIDRAIAAGNLNESTTHVTMLFGFNDSYKHVAPISSEAFGRDVGQRIDDIRAHAPNARLMILTYPTLTDGSGNACFIHANALAPFGEAGKLRTPLPALVFAEDSIHTAQRETAESKGAEFVDIREATRGHGLCAPDPERYVSGYIDDQQEYYTASQLTHTGVREVAKIIAERF